MAVSLADAIKNELQFETKLIPGGGGVLDITLDGKLVFSKHQAGYKPEPKEVVELLRG